MGQSRSIKKVVQLVTQSNNCFLLPRLLIQNPLSLSFSLSGDVTKETNLLEKSMRRDIFLKENFQITSFRNIGGERKTSYIQKIQINFIAKNGTNLGWKFILPNKLYLSFVNLKSPEDLEKFIEKSGFSVFPTQEETTQLLKEYEERGIKKTPIFIATRGTKTIDSNSNKLKKIIRDVNLEFIWKKKLEMSALVEKYQKDILEYNELQKINNQLEDVSEILINEKHPLLNELSTGISDDEIEPDNRTLGEIIGMEKIKDLKIIPASRIYGHYAYCFFEFYLDILQRNKIMVCNNCLQYNKIDRGKHSDREFCTRKENEKCFLETQAKRKKKARLKK